MARQAKEDPRYLWCVDCSTMLGAVTADSPRFSDALVKRIDPATGHAVEVLARSAVHRLAGDMTALEALERLAAHRGEMSK